MKSTTPERLAVCRRVTEYPPSEVSAAVQSVVATIARVTDMRIRLMRYLVVDCRWPVAGAKAFVLENGKVWR